MDLTESIVPKSDQLNSDDLVTGPVTVTITEVRAGNAEQPVEVHLAEFPGRPYKPSKSMRRVLVQGWGAEASAYTGRRITLFRNPEIKFGGATVGGIEISAMSHLAKRLTVSLMVTRGKRKPFSVDPLPELAPVVQQDWVAVAKQAEGDADTLRAIWTDARDAGAPKDVLDTIRSLAAPVETPATSTV
jgi:hypothetical protein